MGLISRLWLSSRGLRLKGVIGNLILSIVDDIGTCMLVIQTDPSGSLYTLRPSSTKLTVHLVPNNLQNTLSLYLFHITSGLPKAKAAILLKRAFIMYLWLLFSLLSFSADAVSIARFPRYGNCTVSAARIRAELGPQLSAKATIVDAEHGDLERATERWQEYNNPTFISAVQVATVKDIIKTVRLLIAIANATELTILCR